MEQRCECKGEGKREVPEKTHRPATSYSTISTCRDGSFDWAHPLADWLRGIVGTSLVCDWLLRCREKIPFGYAAGWPVLSYSFHQPSRLLESAILFDIHLVLCRLLVAAIFFCHLRLEAAILFVVPSAASALAAIFDSHIRHQSGYYAVARRLDWPVQSPDLNPIEHLWDELYRRERARQERTKSIAQLMEWLQEELRRIPMDVLQTLVGSMPDRLAAVIAARGTCLATQNTLQYRGETTDCAAKSSRTRQQYGPTVRQHEPMGNVSTTLSSQPDTRAAQPVVVRSRSSSRPTILDRTPSRRGSGLYRVAQRGSGRYIAAQPSVPSARDQHTFQRPLLLSSPGPRMLQRMGDQRDVADSRCAPPRLVREWFAFVTGHHTSQTRVTHTHAHARPAAQALICLATRQLRERDLEQQVLHGFFFPRSRPKSTGTIRTTLPRPSSAPSPLNAVLSTCVLVLVSEVLRADKGEASAGTQGQGKWKIPEKTRPPSSSSNTIPTCENPGVTRPGIEPGSSWWEASRLTIKSLLPLSPLLNPIGKYNMARTLHTSSDRALRLMAMCALDASSIMILIALALLYLLCGK
ncbi:hypothetical protein PR048_030769 [Dryococelus australis]|uniref:Tc1-like transposase DDE domain-containing protein n=1 Tax=Dryococelus australis TaxID=614101 RepID=A0ABQ9G9U3_9NEOP|nr:hypothetical protein PR048_030769 [Dryococelus australis]